MLLRLQAYEGSDRQQPRQKTGNAKKDKCTVVLMLESKSRHGATPVVLFLRPFESDVVIRPKSRRKQKKETESKRTNVM